jgi:hypothetical protein
MRLYFGYKQRISLIEGAFLGGKPEKRSEGGPRARACNPLPGNPDTARPALRPVCEELAALEDGERG